MVGTQTPRFECICNFHTVCAPSCPSKSFVGTPKTYTLHSNLLELFGRETTQNLVLNDFTNFVSFVLCPLSWEQNIKVDMSMVEKYRSHYNFEFGSPMWQISTSNFWKVTKIVTESQEDKSWLQTNHRRNIFHSLISITRIQRMREAMFSVCLSVHGGGGKSGVWSQVLSLVSRSRSFPWSLVLGPFHVVFLVLSQSCLLSCPVLRGYLFGKPPATKQETGSGYHLPIPLSSLPDRTQNMSSPNSRCEGNCNVLVGLTRTDGTWMFTDGTTYDYVPEDEWFNGDDGDGQDCARLTKKIGDIWCSSDYDYICMVNQGHVTSKLRNFVRSWYGLFFFFLLDL